MKQKKLWEISFPLICLLISFISNCNPIKPKSYQPKSGESFRFIDCLKAKNVVNTPFKNIIKNFKLIQEDLNEKLIFLHQLSTRSHKVWAATTQRPILGYDEDKKPHEMEIFLNKKRIDFLNESDKDSIKWKWVKTDRNIELHNDDRYNKGFESLILEEGNTFSFEIILPDDDIELEIRARRNWHPHDLEIYLDDKFIKKIGIERPPRIFTFKQRSSLNNYRITLKATISKRLEKKKMPVPPRLLINWIKIKTQKDVILFFVPSKHQKNFEHSRLSTQYLTENDDSGQKNKYLGFYKMKHAYALSKFDQDENPENIKKKIAFERIWLNTLMAPPPSQFEFDIHIPPQSLLEFGIGALKEENADVFPPLKFKIFVSHKKMRKVLYEKVFYPQPGDQRNQLIFEKIDLSAFAKQDIKMTFLTERLSRINDDSSGDNVFSFWFNPLIYQPSPEKLKIILVSIDTLRADHLGSYGYSRNTSPNLDELAKDSVLFKNVYAQSPWTLPSHVSILYSLNSASHQVYYKDQKIDDSLPSLSSYLKKSGFITYAFTGGGFVSSLYGFSKGYDWYDEPVKGRYGHLRPDESGELFKYTADWIKKNKDKQFFLFLHTFQTHGPYDCPSPWNEIYLDETAKWKRFALRIYLEKMGYSYPFSPEEIRNIIGLYDGEIKYTDEALIKPLIAFLKELEIYDNTLLIITSDHGEEFADHGGWEHGHTVYDELIRVPLIIKFPKSQFKGKTIDTICRTTDIMPTILELASIKFNKNQLDGKSLMDLILEKESKDRVFISDLAHKDLPDPCPALIATNENRLKLILDKTSKGTEGLELYDLLKDPSETKNILQKEISSGRALLKFINDYYNQEQKFKRKIEKVNLDRELKEKLKALGYLR